MLFGQQQPQLLCHSALGFLLSKLQLFDFTTFDSGNL